MKARPFSSRLLRSRFEILIVISANLPVFRRTPMGAPMTAQIPPVCRGCGAEAASLTARYCYHCGEELNNPAGVEPPVPPRMAAAQVDAAHLVERRQTTVLLCDLVDSTVLTARLDPEEVLVVLRAFFNATTAVVHRHNGFVARHMGDGLLVYFGYPRAEEHSAEFAVRAALELLKAVDALRPLPGVSLQLRVGIATGIVVIGDLIGAGSSREAPALGVTPNLASRLQSLASPGTVVISRETYSLVGTLFDCAYLGTHQLKGFSAPAEAWQVVRTRSVESRFDAKHPQASLTRLFGRHKELTKLKGRWGRVCQGQGQVAFVMGDPGIGKSKLVNTFLESVRAETSDRLRLQCAPNFENTAFYPVIDWLHRLGEENCLVTAESPARCVERAIATRYGCSDAQASLIGDLLVPPKEEGLAITTLAAERRKEETLEALRGVIAAVAAKGAGVVVVEDAHWADPSTLELLARLAQALSRMSILLLITCRPQFDTARILTRSPAAIVLGRLGEKDSAALVRQIYPVDLLEADLLRLIVARADGIPLFVEELAKSVLESSAIAASEDRAAYSTATSARVPATLRDSLMARLDRQPAGKAVAQIAATIGREFSYPVLAAVAEIAPERLDHALIALREAGLISLKHGVASEGYAFNHALMQEIAYDSLLAKRRQELHLRIAGVLEAQYPELAGTRPEVLAYHYTEAADRSRSAQFWRMAGLSAARRFANKEAIGSLRRALDALSFCAKTPERDAGELELCAILGSVLATTYGPASAEVERCLHRARALFSLVSNNAHKVLTLKTECYFFVTKARYGEAYASGKELAQLGCELQDGDAQATADFTEGVAHLYQGKFSLARGCFEHGIEVARALRTNDLAVQCRGWLGRTLWFQGFPDSALKQCSRALALARRSIERRTEPLASSLLATVHQGRGDLEAMRKWVESTLRQSTIKGYSYWLNFAEILDAWLRTRERMSSVTRQLPPASPSIRPAARGWDCRFTICCKRRRISSLDNWRRRSPCWVFRWSTSNEPERLTTLQKCCADRESWPSHVKTSRRQKRSSSVRSTLRASRGH
jgi:class 3 adenylate cyclase/tetratricopeptide (TPR) repeat protein